MPETYNYRSDWFNDDGEVEEFFGRNRRSCLRKAKVKSEEFGTAYVVGSLGSTDQGSICYTDGQQDYKDGSAI